MKTKFFFHRSRRIARRVPRQALIEFVSPFVDRSQFLSALVTGLVTYFAIRSASPDQVTEEIASWLIYSKAFVVAASIWAFISMLRAPFIVIKRERDAGQWYGNRFVYHTPQLVFVKRCRATGSMEKYRFKCDDAEPNAFVSFILEADGHISRELISAAVTYDMILSLFQQPGNGLQQGGSRIGPDKEAVLVVAMRADALSKTMRVYIRDFCIDNPVDQDGDIGDT